MASLSRDVIAAARSAQAATGIPASVSLAQWAVESAWGSRCTGTFNYFGVKAAPGQPSTVCATHEVIDGQRVAAHAAFANYSSEAKAFTAHAELLATGARYAPARAALPDVTAFIQAMAPVYATDPNYADLLLEIVREHDLQQYDKDPA
jgi:flagellum-specific peptidoglycan hydrolase FlgJ